MCSCKVLKIQNLRKIKGPFGLRGEGSGVKKSRVEFVENMLILEQFYSTLLPPFPLNPNEPKG